MSGRAHRHVDLYGLIELGNTAHQGTMLSGHAVAMKRMDECLGGAAGSPDGQQLSSIEDARVIRFTLLIRSHARDGTTYCHLVRMCRPSDSLPPFSGS